jgi:hypothetical protein
MVTAMERAADPEAARRIGLVPEVMAKPVTGASFGRLLGHVITRPRGEPVDGAHQAGPGPRAEIIAIA